MKKLESSVQNMVIVLVGVALITGCILAYVNHATEGPIAEQKEKTLADGIKAVMGGGELSVCKTDTVRQNDEKGKEMVFVIYGTEDAQKNYLGAAVESTTGGFGGDLKVLVGFDPKGTILGYTILEHAETPGLGAKADTLSARTLPRHSLLRKTEVRLMPSRRQPLPAALSSKQSIRLTRLTRLCLSTESQELLNKQKKREVNNELSKDYT